VVAETFEAARYAAALVRVDYDVEPHDTNCWRTWTARTSRAGQSRLHAAARRKRAMPTRPSPRRR
jgi:CO/xanthine dehydrogenase Mo-binding subunit